MILKKRYIHIIKILIIKKFKKAIPIYINLYKYKFKFILYREDCNSLFLLIFILKCEVSFQKCEVSFQLM